ncbi:carboxylic ester hydrolase [Mycobacterium paraintracellulare]|uniref:carboxylesterase/lipase family protein n=1 Tax=Mycobacterium paraintracellulare TaxID=1138383 RepID=UPI00192938EB|nr:carboxylesterase/lipase family protein [Mycobacterium paraintracellulare]BCO39058.1 carboxylic ester hydrolase [Mycobacterium paraintracellulare]
MSQRDSRVNTTMGTVVGFTGDDVVRWRGIPYARPPLGPLRLRSPQPAVPWRGARYCDQFGFAAPQKRAYTLIGFGKFQPTSEDCLTLNVVAPARLTDESLPVMFYVHGGAYFLGSSATPVYDGAALARRGCVYVSANYRVGALGCMDLSSLSTPDIEIDGNLFLRDLVMAMQWVRDNIAAFGGDPGNVTICGESAGAHAVATLLAVPAAEGLFDRAISQSSTVGLVRTADEAGEFAERFAALLGTRHDEAAAALMQAEPARLIAAAEQLFDAAARESIAAPFGPCVDGDFLPHDPLDAMASGTAHRVPLMVGSTADEARLFTRMLAYLPTSEPMIEQLLADTDPALRTQIMAAYPNYPTRDACIQLGGDGFFGAATWLTAEAHSGHAPTYRYRYDYAPRILRWLGLGATHGTDLLALFDIYRSKLGRALTLAGDRRSALRVSDDVQTRWLTFARTGTPGAGWPPYREPDRTVMIFDRTPRAESDPSAARRVAWQEFARAR